MSSQQSESEILDKEALKQELEDALKGGQGPKAVRFTLAALGGLIPYVGSAIGTATSAWSEQESDRFQKILRTWLKIQEDEIKEIGKTLIEVMSRIDQANEKVQQRIESQEYLSLIKKCFRDWSAAESEEKRIIVRNLLANAAVPGVTSDDVIRLFIEWIDRYSELHFKVVRAIYNHSGITRGDVWNQIHGQSLGSSLDSVLQRNDTFSVAKHCQ
ncbi:MAG: hypothetical protein AB1540_04840 [Bdellovibrionota bacterium]